MCGRCSATASAASNWPAGGRRTRRYHLPRTADRRRIAHCLPARQTASAGTDPQTPIGPNSNNAGAGGRDGVLIVGGNQAAAGEYASLAAACEAAKTGDIIELRFNGRLDERPIRLPNLKLTIRAAEGFQPVVRFRPQDQRSMESSRGAVVIAGGSLSLLGLGLEFEVPRDLPADDWTLFELRQPETVRLESCTLTVRNTTSNGSMMHPDVAFFRIRSPGAVSIPLSTEKGVHTSALLLQLRNCIARGAATFVQAEGMIPLTVQWDNGILASGQRLTSIAGYADSPPRGATVQFDLRHLTALVRAGLVEMTATADGPYLPSVEFTAADSIFLVDQKSPLVSQTGDDELEQLRKRLTWKGDRLFYEGVVTFWRVANPENVEDYAAKQWQTFWGDHDQHPHYGDAAWQVTNLENVDRNEFQRLTPADFKLRPGENPARRGGSDGRDAGCQLDLLPTSAREPARAESP